MINYIFLGISLYLQPPLAFIGYSGQSYDRLGANKTIPITEHDLQYLQLVVRGAGSNTRTRYNYFQSHLISADPHIDWSRKTLVYVGGYGDSPDFPNARVMEKLYINAGYNVILLDELYFVLTPDFPLVASMTRYVSYHVAEMLATVYRSGAMDPSRVEMIGISLGGHTMGFIAKSFHRLTGKKMSRLTGLDPCGPCFRNAAPEDRLAETDAEFVDVIHTDINWFGMSAPMGHVDFYLNGGESQVSDTSILQYCEPLCSHVKAYKTWVTALGVTESNFIAVKCKSLQQAVARKCYDNEPVITNSFGLGIDKTKHGIFFLATYEDFPYYMGERGLKNNSGRLRASKKWSFVDLVTRKRVTSIKNIL